MKSGKSLFIEPTPKTPEIDFNQLNGELILAGKSIPENAAKVYEPVYNWITEYVLEARPTTNMRLKLDYFNTSSSLWLVKILKALIKIDKPDYVLIVHLYIPLEDFDDIEEFGDIKDIFSPITGIFYGAIPSIGLKIYGTTDDGKIVKDKLVFIEQEKIPI
jgi:hypothetical protein